MSSAVAFAFAAGALSTVNPCGFAVLPAFLAYYLGAEAGTAPSSLTARLARGLGAGAAVSVGFAAVFTVAGLLLAAGLRLIIGAVPWAAVAVGAGLTVLGVLLLAGRKIGITVNANGLAGDGKGARGLMAFGAAYALASLSCTVAVLLAVVGQALAAADVVAVLAVFAAYAAGAASVLVLLTVSAALASGALARVVRRALPFAGRVSGAFLVLSGLYLIAYWVPQLAGQRDGTALSRGGGALAGNATQWLEGHTSTVAAAAGAVVVVVAALVTAAALRSRQSSGPADNECCPPVPAHTSNAGTRTD
ncbi:MAG: cytochrome C biogenesis protein [Actinomycetota bacterium]|nr:cytochrome C biogenesis protein [Actinomycetota bacterium]